MPKRGKRNSTNGVEPLAARTRSRRVAGRRRRRACRRRRNAAAASGRAARVPQRISRPLVRLAPEARDQRAQQQHLHAAHPRSAAASRTRGTRAGRAGRSALSGEYSLSIENSARCVLPVRSTSRLRSSRSTSHGCSVSSPACAASAPAAGRRSRARRAVVARLVHARRLARRADEHAREQVRQRRMVLPVGDEAAQQVGPAQQRAVRRRRAAERDVIAAAGARVAAVEHELLGARAASAAPPRTASSVVAISSSHDAAGWMLTSMTPGSGVTVEHPDARIARRRIAFDRRPAARCARAVSSTRRAARRTSSSRSSGGMKTCRWPSRTSTYSAVLITSRGAPPRTLRPCVRGCDVAALAAARRAARTDRPADSAPRSSGRTSGSEPSGSRRPSGESPATRYRRSRRSGHGLDSPAASPLPSGSAALAAAARSRPACRGRAAAGARGARARRASSGRPASGSTLTGSAASVAQQLRHVLVGGDEHGRGGRPSALRELLARSACASASVARARRASCRRSASASLPQRLAVGAPVHAERPARQRLARIPLALPEVQQPPGAKRAREPAQQRLGRARASSATARCSSTPAPSMSSIDTNVGSPPCVRRTSCAASSRVDLLARARRSPPTARRCTAW